MGEINKMKIVLLGPSGVGKTCLINRYIKSTFEPTEVTKNSNFNNRILKLPNGEQSIKLTIWDTAGQELYRSLASFYYKDADGIIFVYDITDKNSFKELNNWIEDVEQNGSPDVLFTIVGNKSDLQEQEAVSYKDGDKLARSKNAKFFLTSAKENLNVTNMFEEMVDRKFSKQGKAFKDRKKTANNQEEANKESISKTSFSIKSSSVSAEGRCCK